MTQIKNKSSGKNYDYNTNTKTRTGKIVGGVKIDLTLPLGFQLTTDRNGYLRRVSEKSLQAVRKLGATEEQLKQLYGWRNNNSQIEYYEIRVKENNKKKQIGFLIAYSLAAYAAMIGCYGIVFALDEYWKESFENTFGKVIGGISQDVVKNIAYLAAILIGIQAFNIVFKIINISAFNKNFDEKVEKLFDEGEEGVKEIRNIKRDNNVTQFAAGATMVASTAGLFGMVGLLAGGLMNWNALVPLVVTAILAINRICFAFMTKALEQNRVIDREFEKRVETGEFTINASNNLHETKLSI